MNAGSFELNIAVPSHGRSTKIREYGHQGRTYVEGRKGQPFSILFRNNSAERVLAIPSVDGVSVLDGNAATDASRGYVVNAYASIEIKGWRTSLNDVAQFVFETRDGSYAATGPVGDGRNCGVIGCVVLGENRPKVVIREKHVHHHHYPRYPLVMRSCEWEAPPPMFCGGHAVSGDVEETYTTYTTNTSELGNVTGQGSTGASSATACFMNQVQAEPVKPTVVRQAAAPDFNLGAGFGTALVDAVAEVTFERGARLALLEIYYTDAGGLRAAGIDLHKSAAVSAVPSVFPAAFNGFCQPPR